MFAASKSGKAAAAVATDTYFPYVPLLLESTSTNGQQNNTFLDSSTNNFTITRTGTPTQGSVTPYWTAGQWSVYFSSSYLSVADSASLRFGAANFTIEAWVFRTASGATHTIACKGSSTGPTGWVFQISSSDKLVFIDTSTSITGSTSLAANTWYYVAVVRAGTGASQTTLYVNGASDGTGTSATTFSQTDAMRIGTDRSATNSFAGYISNLRLSNTNLTISSTPTTPLTALGSTIFLSCGYNRFLDGSSLASAITVGSGTPQVQAFQPFPPNASYTTAAYGGSGCFDGSTSRLTTSTSSAFDLSATNFTLEFWMYMTANPSGAFNRLITTGANGLTSSIAVQFSTSGQLYVSIIGPSGASVTGPVIPLNTWTHVAFTLSTSTGTLYINGSQYAQTTGWSISSANGYFYVGYDTAGTVDAKYNGYISNIRLVKGTVVYTGAFTPPTLAPITTAGSTSAASYPSTTNVNTSFASSNTSILLNFTNAGIYDAAVQNNEITTGTAQASTTQYKWSPTSMKFASGDTLSILFKPQLQLGTGDFTIDGWLYYTGSGNQTIITSGSGGFTIYIDNNGNALYFVNSGGGSLTGPSLTASTWIYFAIVRSGTGSGNLKIYTNGTLGASGTNSDNYNQTNNFTVGGGTFAGYLQDLRITKGIARTVTTVPTAAFPTR